MFISVWLNILQKTFFAFKLKLSDPLRRSLSYRKISCRKIIKSSILQWQLQLWAVTACYDSYYEILFLGIFCVLMIYCALNVYTFKLFLKEHIVIVCWWLFLLLVIIGFDNDNCIWLSRALDIKLTVSFVSHWRFWYIGVVLCYLDN